MKDESNYMTHGTNKQVYYKIFHSVEEIDATSLVSILKEAVEVDKRF